MSDTRGYRILDEPTPGALAAYVVNPTFPMLALMLAGTWLAAPWFAFNALALGSPTARREIGLAIAMLAGAFLLLIINLIGLGLGPLLTGMLSDAFKDRLVGAGSDELAATAQGLRYALVVTTCVNVWSAFHYVRGARTLREDLATAARAAA